MKYYKEKITERDIEDRLFDSLTKMMIDISLYPRMRRIDTVAKNNRQIAKAVIKDVKRLSEGS